VSELERYEDVPANAAQMATIDPVRTTAQLANVEKFFRSAMKRGVHYGTIPGVDKPFLWKSGAELLGGLFQFGVRAKRDELLSHVDRPAERVEITVKAIVFSRATGNEIWDADGFASSMEACFRRKACPDCGKTAYRDRSDRSVKDRFECGGKCGWSGKEEETVDALANDFGTTIRNVAARAEKRAKVRALAEATGVTGFFLTPQNWEQEEDAAVHSNGKGNCPKCGVGTLVERARKLDGAPFWACNNGSYDPKTRKRTGCDHIQNSPPSAPPEPSDPDVPDKQVGDVTADITTGFAVCGAKDDTARMVLFRDWWGEKFASKAMPKAWGHLPPAAEVGQPSQAAFAEWLHAPKEGEQ